jgi:hypothetical protein
MINAPNLTNMSYAFSGMWSETESYLTNCWGSMQPLRFYINAPKLTIATNCFSNITAFPIGGLKANLQNITSLENFCRDSWL